MQRHMKDICHFRKFESLTGSKSWIAFSVALALLCQIFAVAQEIEDPFGDSLGDDLFDISLDELTELTVGKVEGASKREQLTSEAPASVSIVTSEEIQRYGYRTLADVLQSVRGFHVSYDRTYHFLGTRGVSQQDFNSHVLILVNGHRINNNLTDGGVIGTALPLDVDLIKRVEVIRGPGSVLYGNNAFFGVINVVTKRGADFGTGEVSGEVASYDTYKGRVTYGNTFKNELEVLFSGSYQNSDGEEGLFFPAFNTPINNQGIVENGDKDEYGSFFGVMQWRAFTLQGSFIEREKGNPTAPFFSTFNDPRSITEDQRSYVNLKFEHEVSELFDVTALTYYDRYQFDVALPFAPPFVLADVLNRLRQEGEWWGTEIRFGKTIMDKHRITLGAEYRDDFRQHSTLFDEDPFDVLSVVDRDRSSYGIYLEGEFNILTNLTLNTGGRFDDYSEFDSNVSPRVALIYNPFEGSTLKALYGTAFRTPTFRELFDPRIQNVATDEITSYELAYEQSLGRNLRATANIFYNEMGNLFSINSLGAAESLDAEARGIEFGLDGVWENGLRGRVSYTLQDTEDTATGNRLIDSPEHLAKFNLSAPVVKEKLFAGLEVQYSGERATLKQTKADDFAIINLTLFGPDLLDGLDLSASVYNLFDKNYADPSGWIHLQDLIPRVGRAFRLKLVYRF